MFTRVLVSTIAGFLLLVQPGHSQPQAAVERYRAGFELLKSRNFRNAAIELEQAARVDSTYGAAHFLLGQAYENLNEYRKAISSFEAAQRSGISRERLAKRLSRLHRRFALENFQQRKYTEAIQSFEAVLELEPGSSEAQYNLGLCHARLRNSDAAKRAFGAATTADPRNAKPHKALGDLHRQDRAPALAKAAYERAIERDSTYTGAYGGLAQILVEQDDVAGAIFLLRRATRIDPQHGEGFLLLGSLLTRLEKPQEAVPALAQAVKLRPQSAETHYRLGEAYLAVSEYDKAVVSGNAALSLDGDYHPAEVLLGDTYARLGQLKKARSWYLKAINDSRFKDYCAFKLDELTKGTP